MSRRSRFPDDAPSCSKESSVYDSLESHNLMLSIERLDLRLASVKEGGSRDATHRSVCTESSSGSQCSSARTSSSGGSSARSVLQNERYNGSRIPVTFKARSMSAPHGRANGLPRSLTSKYFAPSGLHGQTTEKCDGSAGPGRQRRGQQGQKVRRDVPQDGDQISIPSLVPGYPPKVSQHVEELQHANVQESQSEARDGRLTMFPGARALFPIAESTSSWAFTTQRDYDAKAELDSEGLL